LISRGGVTDIKIQGNIYDNISFKVLSEDYKIGRKNIYRNLVDFA